jgi:hypothetical protein
MLKASDIQWAIFRRRGPAMVTAEQKELVLSKILGEELAQLVLELAKMESPSGQEEAGRHYL